MLVNNYNFGVLYLMFMRAKDKQKGKVLKKDPRVRIVETLRGYGIKLYDDVIADYSPCGMIFLSVNDHPTRTTLRHLNGILPDNLKVFKHRGDVWIMNQHTTTRFKNGMKINILGDILG